jgi:hypothetical protein
MVSSRAIFCFGEHRLRKFFSKPDAEEPDAEESDAVIPGMNASAFTREVLAVFGEPRRM